MNPDSDLVRIVLGLAAVFATILIGLVGLLAKAVLRPQRPAPAPAPAPDSALSWPVERGSVVGRLERVALDLTSYHKRMNDLNALLGRLSEEGHANTDAIVTLKAEVERLRGRGDGAD